MGSALTAPFVLLSRGITTLVEKGIHYSISYAFIYIYFSLERYLTKRRLNLYDAYARDDPEKLAFYVPKQEWALETPQRSMFLLQNADDVSCFGVNSKEQFLCVYISRKPGSRVHQALQLQLGDGKRYWLPEEHINQKETDEDNTFGSARLKMECLLPMRRWRIFYNGLLWEQNGSEKTLKHVKFAFLWVASANIYDQTTDFSIPMIAHAAASQEHVKPLAFAQNLLNMCSGYYHPGMYYGTVEVEGDEAEEVYLWGDKSRNMGEMARCADTTQFEETCLNAENGTYIHIKTLTLPRDIYQFRYGYLMKPNGNLRPLDECEIIPTMENVRELTCVAGGETFKMALKMEKEGKKFTNRFGGESNAKFCKAVFRGMTCKGIFKSGVPGERSYQTRDETIKFNIAAGNKSLTLSICDSCCQDSNLTGGKGSSLAKLHAICENAKDDLKFQVPRGVVVTTAAYEKFLSKSLEHKLNTFQSTIWKSSSDFSELCKKISEEVMKEPLPDMVIKSIQEELISVFGEGYAEIKFAVRSSATGEDTEQMSAAGQMDTFLGVKGFDEILKSLRKCWASQFGYIAVQYKRRYGQLINCPMAVVIQEMVPCEIAGVLFTCDPVSGNPTSLSISANYGLGESVVSASSEPDTITLMRNLKNEIVLHSKQVGNKKSKVVMTETVGVVNVDLGDGESANCCLDDAMALKLGKVAIEIENQYGNPRDMEWGIIGEQLYLLQARPVTSINVETDFEIKHAMDSYIRREDEYTTKANVGEVFCGATSPLGMDLMGKLTGVTFPRYKHLKGLITEVIEAPPYYPNGIMSIYGHAVFLLCDAFFKFSETGGGKMSDYTKAMSVALLGRVVEDQRLFKMAQDRHPAGTTSLPLYTRVALVLMMFFAGFRNRYLKKKLAKLQIPIREDTAAGIFRTISHNYHQFDISMVSHMECTFSSSFWNLNILSLLAKKEGDWDTNVYGDFAYLMSTCSQVESADVPSTLQRLGYTISKCIKPEEFKKMSVEEALKWLSTNQSDARIQFRNFLDKHGHRGIKEFDIHAKMWGHNQKPLVKMLQGMVSEDLKDATERDVPSTSAIISKLAVHLDFFSKLSLRFILPNCQRCVREREYSKSVLIKQFDKIRGAFNSLAKAMVQEGRLPNEEYIFFLNVEEIRQLLRTRCPRIVAKAQRRCKLYPEMDKLIFPEICVGIPKPINMSEDIRDVKSDLVMTGVPVSHGVVTARACVILNVEDATTIKSGDVLITYATDIGWSPYFPLLSGVVTELGGLVSHGAVVAREYGLPCVVNLHGSTRLFKTGDIVHLDGNKGILKRIQPDQS